MFAKTFQDAGAQPPAPALLVPPRCMQSYWWVVIGVIVAGIAALIIAKKRSLKFAHFLDRMSLKMPVMGNIVRNSAIARFARTLGVTFRAGVPLVEALDAVAGATGSIVYGDGVRQMREDIAVGHQLQLAMKQTNLFPNMVVQMTAIGEESGALDNMLFKVAEFYEEEVSNAVDTLSTLLEPIIMVVLGTLVGGMVVAQRLPIFKPPARSRSHNTKAPHYCRDPAIMRRFLCGLSHARHATVRVDALPACLAYWWAFQCSDLATARTHGGWVATGSTCGTRA